MAQDFDIKNWIKSYKRVSKNSTPHNDASPGEIAPVVLMCGDPFRAKYIADKYLTKVNLYSTVRAIPVYTGVYKGQTISVMAHGMGIPSAGIYMYELYKFYNVKAIIRVGTCGAYDAGINIGTFHIAKEAWSNSPYASEIGVKVKNNVLSCSDTLLKDVMSIAKENKIDIASTRMHCTDTFYSVVSPKEWMKTTGSKVVEMESFALYAAANKFGCDGIALLNCSDNIATGAHLSTDDRVKKTDALIQLGLDLASFEAKKYASNKK